jgi:hypothetical protein
MYVVITTQLSEFRLDVGAAGSLSDFTCAASDHAERVGCASTCATWVAVRGIRGNARIARQVGSWGRFAWHRESAFAI